jgi:hypothetical protein
MAAAPKPEVNVLAEYDPRDAQREEALEVEQQRGRGRVGPRQPDHEEDRTDDTAGQDDSREHRDVSQAERRLRRADP